MSKAFPPAMRRLVEALGKLPGIGPKSAQRLAFHILRSPETEIGALVGAVREVRNNVRFCGTCNNLSEGEKCSICSDPSRDRTVLCAVESPSSVLAVERSSSFRGLYHVLLGSLSPLEGIGPDELKINRLAERVRKEGIKEVIIATDFTTEGETTALYISRILKPLRVKVTRLARGVPVGASLEYADVATLQRAIEERRPGP